MKLISLILRFAIVLFQLVDEVTRLVHLHSFDALPFEVYYKYNDLRWVVLSNELTSYKMRI